MQRTFKQWLREQVDNLTQEISLSPVFDTNTEPSRDELMELRRLAVIHRFLSGNLEELEARTSDMSVNPLDRIRTGAIEYHEVTLTR